MVLFSFEIITMALGVQIWQFKLLGAAWCQIAKCTHIGHLTFFVLIDIAMQNLKKPKEQQKYGVYQSFPHYLYEEYWQFLESDLVLKIKNFNI